MGVCLWNGLGIMLAVVTVLDGIYGSPMRTPSADSKTASEMIEKVNKKMKGYLFENDITFNLLVQDALNKPKQAQPPAGVSMDAVRNREYLWRTRIIPYVLSSEYSKSERALLTKTMGIIEENSCIRFKKHSNETNWVQIIRNGGGCFSSVGKEYWKMGRQILSLSEGCLSTSIILHELLHVVGFWHEQSRPDRDKYVEIFWENIEDGVEDNFKKYSHEEADVLGLPYDYQSVMHYERKSGSKNGRPTILAIGNKSQQLGNSNTLTPIDIIQINRLYDCPAKGATGLGFVSSWSSFGPCDFGCRKRRQRFCSHSDVSKCPNVNAYGVEEEVGRCTASECYAPVDGNWSRWSRWSVCAPDCGPRKQTRRRYCSQPKPKNGGKQCVGEAVESLNCTTKKCGVQCSFDANWCGWRNENHGFFKWIMGKIDTPSSNTGPSRDHTSGKGKYLYVEASSPAAEGDRARLISRARAGTGLECISFWYHMFGTEVGCLRVYLRFSNGTEMEIWQQSGNQGNKWMYANVTVESSLPYRVVFEAQRGTGPSGDIAIDDTNVQVGTCERKNLDKIAGMPIEALGCYGDSMQSRAMPSLLSLNRNLIQWRNFDAFLSKVLRLCAEQAKRKGHKYIGLQFYSECWSSSHDTAPFRYGPSTECVNGKFKECLLSRQQPCTGRANANYIYKLLDLNM